MEIISAMSTFARTNTIFQVSLESHLHKVIRSHATQTHIHTNTILAKV